MPTPRKTRRLLVLGVMVGVGGAAVAYSLRPPSPLDFRLHHTKYEAIVRRAKKAGPNHLNLGQFWLRDGLDASTLTAQKPADGGVSVSLTRNETGDEVRIATSDEGHAGYMGYIYSDGAAPRPDFPIWPIAPHWWGFHDNKW